MNQVLRREQAVFELVLVFICFRKEMVIGGVQQKVVQSGPGPDGFPQWAPVTNLLALLKEKTRIRCMGWPCVVLWNNKQIVSLR